MSTLRQAVDGVDQFVNRMIANRQDVSDHEKIEELAEWTETLAAMNIAIRDQSDQTFQNGYDLGVVRRTEKQFMP